ncbi:hypothetical protein LIER_10391 [Lithospermum erythrorhizon]|uniref:Uncharacterized protein n=1 Tax=Lithospermum erythrorhizon TaxID=34254 RepID=A0AAV3PL42_LITER
MISNVEKHKKLHVLDPLDVSAMQSATRSRVLEGGQKFDYYQKKGHLRRDCFKLKGYTDWWPGVRYQKKKEKANVIEEMDTPMEYRLDEQTNSKNLQNMITFLLDILQTIEAIKQHLIPVADYKDPIVTNSDRTDRQIENEVAENDAKVTGARKRRLHVWFNDYEVNSCTSDGSNCVV